MAVLFARREGGRASLLGRGGGLLLIVLGLTILALLFWVTQGHRARLLAEALGVLVGAILTITVVGLSRPSALVATRAYVSLSAHARALLVAGICMVFGFAVVTAAIEPAVPRLRDIPTFGGLVTLDWVLSLSVLAAAGATVLLTGAAAAVAHAAAAPPTGKPAENFLLERLAHASNSGTPDLLRSCFAPSEDGECAYRTWIHNCITTRPPRMLLVRSGAIWGQTWSEWHRLTELSGAVDRLVVAARVENGLIADVQVFRLASASRDSVRASLSNAGLPPDDPSLSRRRHNATPLQDQTNRRI